MGADFSLPRFHDPPSHPPPPSRRRSSHRRRYTQRLPDPAAGALVPYSDSSTIANTLANRSPTPVARHVALARLADRLTSMAKSRREHVIEQLHIPTDVLREVNRYTPSNSFGSMGEDDLLSERGDEEEREGSDSEGNDIDSELSTSPGSPFREEPSRPRRKIVSFAKYAEMRLFRE